MQVKPGIQFVASLGGQVGTMEVQDARGYHPELRVFFSDPERNRIDLDIFA